MYTHSKYPFEKLALHGYIEVKICSIKVPDISVRRRFNLLKDRVDRAGRFFIVKNKLEWELSIGRIGNKAIVRRVK